MTSKYSANIVIESVDFHAWECAVGNGNRVQAILRPDGRIDTYELVGGSKMAPYQGETIYYGKPELYVRERIEARIGQIAPQTMDGYLADALYW
jgi:hypothetical protein